MLLNNAAHNASFDPMESVIQWGFSRLAPVPTLAMDFVTPRELSDALHEFTHQAGMQTSLGLWYLHAFWRLMAELASGSLGGLPLVKRDRLWEAWWLTSFLLEGQAMYTQLHLVPSATLEATGAQFDFVMALGLDSWKLDASSPSAIARGVTKLFEEACASCHADGIKRELLLSREPNSTLSDSKWRIAQERHQ